jgi:hypothetical protein
MGLKSQPVRVILKTIISPHKGKLNELKYHTSHTTQDMMKLPCLAWSRITHLFKAWSFCGLYAKGITPQMALKDLTLFKAWSFCGLHTKGIAPHKALKDLTLFKAWSLCKGNRTTHGT